MSSSPDVAPELIRRLLDQAADEPDQLPLLQHLLMRLWDRARAAGRDRLTLDTDDLDALHAALDRHAEEGFAESSHRISRVPPRSYSGPSPNAPTASALSADRSVSPRWRRPPAYRRSGSSPALRPSDAPTAAF